MKQSPVSVFCYLAIMLISLSCYSVFAESSTSTDNLSDAITGGKPMIQFKARYEYVDQANKTEQANAFTLRSLLGWQTLPWHDVSLTAQAINITQLNHAFYDNAKGLGLSSNYPTVQDPEITDINQLYLEYTGIPKTKIKLGRQIVQLDNIRFIGDVFFRQSAQVFDGITATNSSIPNLELFAAHFERVRQTTTKLRDTAIEVLHASYKYSPTASAVAYGYFQDQPITGQNTGFTDNSNQILGVRVDGSYVINPDFKALYTVEYAKQDPYASGDNRIDAHYLRFGGGLGYQTWYVRLDQEILSSNQGQYAFQTPLATLHPFQGWADLFTTTPQQGLRDSYLGAGGKWAGVQFSGEWHRFDSEVDFVTPTGTGSHYGHELDLGATYVADKHWTGKLEYANFKEDNILGSTANATTRKRDTEKVWLTVIYSF